MSEKTARSKAKPQTAANLQKLYKPVGIAALNAATLCQKVTAKDKAAENAAKNKEIDKAKPDRDHP